MKRLTLLITLLFALLPAQASFAAQLRVFVSDMNAIGVPNRDEMRLTLQTLLASRLTNDRVIAVGSAAEADVLVSGTYIVIGKVFSMDAMARTVSGRTAARSFIQGDSSEELISSVGKLADKLSAELTRLLAGGELTPSAPLPLMPPATKTASADIIRSEQHVRRPPTGDIIRPQEFTRGSIGGWVSKRLPGAANLMAIGATLPDGSREIFLAQDNKIQYFRQGDEMKLVGTVDFKANEKVVSLDTADASGTTELYVTIVRDDDLASQVWEVKGAKLNRVASELPYYFRAIALAGGPKKLYAQQMGRDVDYFGDVSEATRSGDRISLKNPVKMPRYGNIYNFNQFRDQAGVLMTLVYNPDGYLVAYGPDAKETWRSTDTFGGTALYFQRDDSDNFRTTGQRFRPVFLNQRIQVTSKNEILVGRNEGLLVVGYNRSYKRGSVYSMAWDGSSLEERWRTKDTQSYMPDYWFDEAKNELLLLQMPQKPGITTDGAASLAIKKVE